MSADLPFIEYGGRAVAVAGRTRCYLAVDDLDEATQNFVAVMCLCKREVDEGRLDGPFSSELAARWARLVMIGPRCFAIGRATDEELAVQLTVPIAQVAIARLEFAQLHHQLAGHEQGSRVPRVKWRPARARAAKGATAARGLRVMLLGGGAVATAAGLHTRYYAGFYVAYGLLAARTALRADRDVTTERALAGTVLLAGLARARG
jgi:hypothetical protein